MGGRSRPRAASMPLSPPHGKAQTPRRFQLCFDDKGHGCQAHTLRLRVKSRWGRGFCLHLTRRVPSGHGDPGRRLGDSPCPLSASGLPGPPAPVTAEPSRQDEVGLVGLLLAPPLPPGTAGGGGLETRSWQLRETPDPYCLETGTEGQMGSMMLSPNLFPHLPLEGNLEGVRGTGGGRLSVPHSGGSD